MKPGKKPIYSPERVRKIVEAVEMGQTYEMAAREAGICKDTLYEWKKKYPEFTDVLKRAKDNFVEWETCELLKDAKVGLKRLICGYDYDEKKTVLERDPTNPNQPRIKQTIITHKTVPPNAAACIFALCNLDPDNWKQRLQQDVNGKVEVNSEAAEQLSRLPDEVIRAAAKSLGMQD